MNRKILAAMPLLFLCQAVFAGEMGSGNTGNIAAPVIEGEVGDEGDTACSSWREYLDLLAESREGEAG